MRVIPRALACSYICPSTSLDTALVHSSIQSRIVRTDLQLENRGDFLTIKNGKLGLVIKYSRHRHLNMQTIRIARQRTDVEAFTHPLLLTAT
jgi:hypothetical protein